MSEDSLIRFDNLNAYCKARKWGPTDLASATGRGVNQCSDMLRRRKSFGEKIARDMEHKLGLPRGWLDEPHDAQDPHLLRYDPVRSDEIAQATLRRAAGKLQFETGGESATKTLRVPIVEWARLGEHLQSANTEWPQPELREFIPARQPKGNRVKLIPVIDDHLAPRIVTGDLIAIDPDNRQPQRNQVVLVKGADGAHLLRRYTPLAGGAFEVIDAAGRVLDSQRHGLAIEGVAVGLIPFDL